LSVSGHRNSLIEPRMAARNPEPGV